MKDGSCLLELLERGTVLVLMGNLEVQESKIVDALEMILFSTLLVKFECLVPIFFNPTSELVTDSEVSDGSGVTSFCSFVEPAESLVKIVFFVEEETPKCVH